MSTIKYPHLFKPVVLGRTLFQNRIFAAPQDYPGVTDNRYLSEEAAYFYERKALGGCAAVCVGDMIIDSKGGRSHPFQMRGDDFLGKANLTRTSTAITRHAAVASIELCHAGKNANVGLMADNRGYALGPSDGIRDDGVEIRQMTEEQIEDLIHMYADAAVFARQCGFGMINLHGGHGWQIHQFISPRDNKRKDKWGGTVENRMRLPLEIIDAIRKRVGSSMVLEFRMSVSECLSDGYDVDEGVAIAKLLDGKVDLINASVGHHEIDASNMITMPSMFLPDGCNLKYAAELKKHIKTPVSTVGAFTSPEMMEEAIASGQADIVELGRETLADPDLPIKARLGKEDEINPCLRCFNCFSHSSIDGVFYCASNPEIGREQAALTAAPAKHKKKVLVAGGGIAGMEAALVAAGRGHTVILCEKSDQLGGALLCEEHIPFKKNLSVYLERQALKVRRSNIELHLNTEVSPEAVKELQPDVIIAAMGARPAVPALKGMKRDNVVGAEEVYYHPEIVGKKAIVLGGGLVGLELGLYLAQNNHDITIVEMAPGTLATPPKVEGVSARMSGVMEVPAGYPFIQGIAIREEMNKLDNIRIMCSTRAVKITDTGLVVQDEEGEKLLEANTIIYAIGQSPLRKESSELSKYAPEFYQVGDCITPRNIYYATSEAYQAAIDIGR
ncbi:MAG: FAD-dependent oxidoreductase, partial [Clostridiaceae bacterium]|nr:FAD-dependent oxidoreductase [Clostridiaceae bacterium]